jgi:hypothetical protein
MVHQPEWPLESDVLDKKRYTTSSSRVRYSSEERSETILNSFSLNILLKEVSVAYLFFLEYKPFLRKKMSVAYLFWNIAYWC